MLFGNGLGMSLGARSVVEHGATARTGEDRRRSAKIGEDRRRSAKIGARMDTEPS